MRNPGIVLLCVLLLLPGSTRAQTPGASPAPAASQASTPQPTSTKSTSTGLDSTDPFAQDARLKQTVAVHAEGIPVSDLLTLLSQKTGVALKADAYVADDKVIAFSPARPLRDTLADLAALYNDEWQAIPQPKGQGDGSPHYLLISRLKARHYEDDLEQEVIARMMAEMEAQVKALGETPGELAKRPAGDHIRQNLEAPSSHARQATRLYSQLNREQRNTLFTQGYLNISFAGSTPAQQTLARDAFTEVVTTLKALDEKQRAEFPNVHIVIDAPDVLEHHGLRFRLTRTNNTGLSGQVLQVILGQNTYMTMGVFGSDSQWLLPPHGSPYLHRSKAKADAKIQADGLPTTDAIRKIGTEGAWIDRLHALADVAEVPLFADCYRSPSLVHDLKASDSTIKDGGASTATNADPTFPNTEASAPTNSLTALDALCRQSGYLWWTQGKTLLLRKRDWYTQRRYEVPDAWLRDMQRRLKRQKSVPTYGDLCRLLDLTPRQISGLNGALENNAAGSDAGMVNLDEEEGLHDLLAFVQASVNLADPLPLGEPAENDKIRQSLPAGPLSPQQVSLIGTFLTTMRQPHTPAVLRNFTTLIYCYTPDMLKVAQSPALNVQLNIIWSVGSSTVPNLQGQRWLLWLPLQIPGDRSDKTQIEVTAPQA